MRGDVAAPFPALAALAGVAVAAAGGSAAAVGESAAPAPGGLLAVGPGLGGRRAGDAVPASVSASGRLLLCSELAPEVAGAAALTTGGVVGAGPGVPPPLLAQD